MAFVFLRLGLVGLCALAPVSRAQDAAGVPSDDDSVGKPVLPNDMDPNAVNAQDVCPGYIASDVKTTGSGLTASLNLAGPGCSAYGNDIENLTLTVEYQDSNRLHVGIQPRFIGAENETWFILPDVIVPKPSADGNTDSDSNDFALSWTNDPTFSFTVTRKSTGEILFTTEGSKIVYEDQFIEFVSPLPENYNLYGLGEVIHGFRLGNNLTRSLWAADVGDLIDANIYGTHPIYVDTRYFQNVDGEETYVPYPNDTTAEFTAYSHGVYLRNAHGQDVLLRPEGITWRTLGGSLDLYFYSGPSATDVIQSYQVSTVGLPAMQSYWTAGFHQCRWGYENWSVVEGVVDNFAKAGIPLETIWTDIDYMDHYRDFENDPVRFSYPEGKEFLSELHASGRHYIPIVDSAIYHPFPNNASDAYPIFDRGVDAEAFVLNPDGSLYIGSVWPGYTVFPDWVGASLGATEGAGAYEWWKNEFLLWYQNVSFDGIWIDMSEVSSFCVGSCGSDAPEPSSSASQTSTATATTAPASTSWYPQTTPTPGVRNINYPPYVINNTLGDLASHALSPNATHHGGFVQYDFHNLFGHQILDATYQALLEVFPEKRPFIIGRSTHASSGRWAGHWGGDNYSLWAYMYFSISQALSFSIFGIPTFGVDTCGFSGNSTEELCNRWMQLSAFFPFYRNHNTIGAASQEPYIWDSVAQATRDAMAIRYSLLPYTYTTLEQAHETGSTVMRALAWEFPNEPWLANAEQQFLLGPSILVTPVLAEGATTVDGVFPGIGDGVTVWYDWYDGAAVEGVARGQNVTIDAPLGHIPVYVRGGSVLPTQEPGMTTRECRENPWGLIVALDLLGAAEGTLYLDDGESLVPNATTWVKLSATNTSITASPSGNYVDSNPLGNVTVLGVPSKVSSVKLNDQVVTGGWSWNSDTKVLSIAGLNNLTSTGTWNADWTLSWSL